MPLPADVQRSFHLILHSFKQTFAKARARARFSLSAARLAGAEPGACTPPPSHRLRTPRAQNWDVLVARFNPDMWAYLKLQYAL